MSTLKDVPDTENRPPPTARLATDTMPLSRMQRLVLETLRSFEDGAKASEIAETLGMHVNTVRGHLDELCDMNAVATEREQSRGRGRPSVIFHARVPSGSAVLSEHAALINALVEHLGDPDDPEVQKTAEQVGALWARRLNRSGTTWSEISEATTTLTRALRQLGFDPGPQYAHEHSASISIHACPFSSDNENPSQLVCAIHRGFLAESLGPCEHGTAVVELYPSARPHTCEVIIRKDATD